MNHARCISHYDALVKELRDDPEFAAEYLKAALEDTDEPKVLLIALRQLAEAKGGCRKGGRGGGPSAGKPLSGALRPREPSTIDVVGRHEGGGLEVDG